jgi:hypothetical protein
VGYVKALIWSTGIVLVLTVAQYSSVHLLNSRPASWVFEASLDLAPPFLFAGDLAQFMFTHGSQAPLREQLPAVAFGLLVNIIVYGTAAVIAVRLFAPEKA